MKQKEFKTAHGCLQFLAVLVIMLFMLVTVPITLVTAFTGTFTSRAYMKTAVDLDSVLRTVMVRVIEADIQQRHFALNLPPRQIDLRQLRRAVDLVIPPSWIDEAVGDGIDNVYNFLEDGRTDDYVFGYAALVESFKSENGREGMSIIVSHYPPCPTSEIPPLEYKERNVAIFCIPTDRSAQAWADDVYDALIAGFDNDPELLASNGGARLEWPPTILADAAQIRRAYEIANQLWLLWLIPLAFLAVMALFAVRSRYGLGMWFGWPFMLTGLLAVVAGLGVSLLFTDILVSILAEIGPIDDELGQLMTSIAVDIANSLRYIWLFGVFLRAGLLFILGVEGIYWARSLKKKAKESLLVKSFPESDPI
jgi:hypothetical protein